MDEYLLSKQIFCRGGKNVNFNLRFGAKLQGGENYLLFNFKQIGKSVSKKSRDFFIK